MLRESQRGRRVRVNSSPSSVVCDSRHKMDPQKASDLEAPVHINKVNLGMSELRPRLIQEGYNSPGATSMTGLMGSPMPESRPPISSGEIMPLLEAQRRREKREKALTTTLNMMKVPALALLLYTFICSLDFLSTSFRLIAGRAAGKAT